MTVMTRKEYVSADRSTEGFPGQIHQRYYSQFVTEDTIDRVSLAFPVDQLTKAFTKDQHFNSIPLVRWDMISFSTPRNHHRDDDKFRATLDFDREALDAAGETVTRATLVCIAKQAARIIVERERTNQKDTSNE